METARLKLPFVANLDVFVVVPAGAGPLEVVARGAAAFLLLQVDDRECAILGKDVGDSFDIAAPYAVAIFERQLANCFTIGQLGYRLFDTFRHGSCLLEAELVQLWKY